MRLRAQGQLSASVNARLNEQSPTSLNDRSLNTESSQSEESEQSFG